VIVVVVQAKTAEPAVYQIHVMLLGVSPTVWRRLLVRSDTSIADLHDILQIAFGWSDAHLQQFTIRGKHYGIPRLGGISFSTDAKKIVLSQFRFRANERFLYEYDFGSSWQHQIRVERLTVPKSRRLPPICIAGACATPPEESGGPECYMEHRHELMRPPFESI
jgi:hypothetical protein